MKNVYKYIIIYICLFSGKLQFLRRRTNLAGPQRNRKRTIGDYEAQAETLTKQMTSLSKVIGSSFITLISQDADGNHVISYSDGGGETHTVTIATQEDAIKLPIITAKQDTDSKFYWAQTTDKGKTYTFILDGDGKKFPIGGTMPDVKINENGLLECEWRQHRCISQ